MKVKLNGNNWYEVTSDFGNQDPAHLSEYHTGIDLAMPSGTEIYSPTNGIVEKIVDFGNNNIGKGVYIKTDSNETLILGHLSDYNVEVGQKVNVGDLVAISGNTGNSTGPHLHMGLKDADGYFINPNKFITENTDSLNNLFNLIPSEHKGIIPLLFEKNEQINEQIKISPDGSRISDGGSVIGNFNKFTDFLNDWKEDGLFQAIYGKPFFEVVKDFTLELLRDIGAFILGNGDLFFLMPAIVFMLGTFIIGKNKYTKWILPLWFLYFISTFFHKMLIV